MRLLQMPARVCVVMRASSEETSNRGVLLTPDFKREARKEINEDCTPWAMYRNHTVVLLRKYFRMSLEIGRMPSLLGGELFRAKVTAYQVHTFEDSVIFVHDMEQCLAKLDPLSRLLIGKIIFQEFTREEMATELRIHERHLRRRLLDGIDGLTRILLEAKLLDSCYGQGGPVQKKPAASESGTEDLEFRVADL
ncbi:MAG TPA: hypothetical protein VFU86_07640 [Terriglobales bacterium]|nr:hypothetical protein [Terriglobales bacterium]